MFQPNDWKVKSNYFDFSCLISDPRERIGSSKIYEPSLDIDNIDMSCGWPDARDFYVKINY